MSKLLGPLSHKIYSNIQNVYTQPTQKLCTSAQLPKKNRKKSFLVVPVTMSEHSKIINLMWDSFHPDEPTTKGMGLGNKRNPFIDQELVKELNDNISLVALNKSNGGLVGAAINSISYPDSAAQLLKFAKCVSCKQTSKLYELNAYIMALPQLHKKYNTNKICELTSLVVSKNYRRQGIAQGLVEESIEYCHNKGFKVMRIDCTNVHAANICKKLGLEKVFELPFNLFVDVDNQPILNIQPPDVSCQTFVHVSKS